MSRSTRNSRDAGLFPGVASAVLLDVLVQSSQPATSSFPAVASMASIAQAVRASTVAEAPPGSLSQSSSLPAVVGTSCSSPPLLGGVLDQDLGAQASALLASGTGFSLQSPLALTSSSQGRPAFVVLSFTSTFAPPTPSLVLSRACSVAIPSVRCTDIVSC